MPTDEQIERNLGIVVALLMAEGHRDDTTSGLRDADYVNRCCAGLWGTRADD